MGGISWWFALLINSISLISIPFFIALSGFLLLGKDETPKRTLERTFWRVFVPLIIWTKLYFIWNSSWHKMLFKEKEIATFLSGGIFHLYFLLIILGLYLLLPIFRTFVRHAPKKDIIFVTSLMLMLGIVFAFVQYRFVRGVSMLNAFTYWVPYLGYFLAGYLLSGLKLSKKQNRILLATFTLGLASTVALTYLNFVWFLQNNQVWWSSGTQYFGDFLSLNVIVMSLSLFTLIMQKGNWFEGIKNKLLLQFIGLVSKTAFGIYLVHLMVIDFVEVKAGFAIVDAHSALWLYLITKYLAVFLASLVIISIWRKIPVLKIALGER